MSNVIERLKELRFSWRVDSSYADNNLLLEAADLIDQQQQRIDELEQRNNELAATVERLREYIEKGAPYSTNPDKCERRRVLEATPQQNLNAVKREPYADGVSDVSDRVEMISEFVKSEFKQGERVSVTHIQRKCKTSYNETMYAIESLLLSGHLTRQEDAPWLFNRSKKEVS